MMCTFLLVHGHVTIIFVVSVGLSVCLSVCLFVCAEFFSAVFDPISIKLGHVVMSCMRVHRKQALSRVKYYNYVTNSKILQATIMTVIMTK